MNRTNLIATFFTAAMLLGASGSLMAADRAKRIIPITNIHFFVKSGQLEMKDKFIIGSSLDTCDIEGRKMYKIWNNGREIQILLFNPFDTSQFLNNWRYQVVSINDISDDSLKYGLLQYCWMSSIKEVRAKFIPRYDK